MKSAMISEKNMFDLAPTTQLIKLHQVIKLNSQIAKEFSARMHWTIKARDDCEEPKRKVKNLED